MYYSKLNCKIKRDILTQKHERYWQNIGIFLVVNFSPVHYFFRIKGSIDAKSPLFGLDRSFFILLRN